MKRYLVLLLIVLSIAAGTLQTNRLYFRHKVEGQANMVSDPLVKGLNTDASINGEGLEKLNKVPIDLSDLSLLCGGQIEEYSLTGWVKIDVNDATESDLKSMVERSVKPLESALLKGDDQVWPVGTWTSGSLEGGRGVNYFRCLGDDRSIESWARSTDSPVEGSKKYGLTYLVVRLSGLTGKQMDESLHSTMVESLHSLGQEESTSMEVICWRDGGMDSAEMSSLVSQVLASAEARELERSDLDGGLSVTAYSPAIPDYEEWNGTRVNLQVAARYRSRDNRTYFHLGIPRIMGDY